MRVSESLLIYLNRIFIIRRRTIIIIIIDQCFFCFFFVIIGYLVLFYNFPNILDFITILIRTSFGILFLFF